jgi:TonB family protein
MPTRFSTAVLATLLISPIALRAQEPQASTQTPQTDTTSPTSAEIRAHGTFPHVVHSVDPSYTAEARDKNINGAVLISVIVDEHGLPTNLKVLHGLGYGLDEEALKAVSKYRFTPGTYKGQVVSVPLVVGVNFRIF